MFDKGPHVSSPIDVNGGSVIHLVPKAEVATARLHRRLKSFKPKKARQMLTESIATQRDPTGQIHCKHSLHRELHFAMSDHGEKKFKSLEITPLHTRLSNGRNHVCNADQSNHPVVLNENMASTEQLLMRFFERHDEELFSLCVANPQRGKIPQVSAGCAPLQADKWETNEHGIRIPGFMESQHEMTASFKHDLAQIAVASTRRLRKEGGFPQDAFFPKDEVRDSCRRRFGKAMGLEEEADLSDFVAEAMSVNLSFSIAGHFDE